MSLDWDFKDSGRNNDTPHIFHPYPARFIPDIPAQLIRLFAPANGAIYDPFMGCGTTAVVANMMGFDAIGNDVNGLSVLISNVKCTPLTAAQQKKIMAVAADSRARARAGHRAADLPPKSREWFEPHVADEISAVLATIAALGDCAAENFCRVALSAILVGVSKQDSDTRYARVIKNIAPLETIVRFERHLLKMIKIMEGCGKRLAKTSADIRTADSREAGVFADDSADFAVTSPPYPNAYDYHLYHKHRLLWLGMDPLELKRQEIGAHAHYSKPNGLTEEDFHGDMRQVMITASRILKNGAFMAIVVGNSILHGRVIQNSALIADAAKGTGFAPVAQVTRNLNARKKSFNPAYGKINQEDILILMNEK